MSEKTFLVRMTEEDHELIRRAAEANGVTMGAWFLDHAVASAKEAVDCIHPIQFRRNFPWSEFCGRCGIRLR